MTDHSIPRERLKLGTVYRVHSRNLDYAVYAGDGWFIGIRSKFDDRFLSQELEMRESSQFGTLRALEEVGTIPEGIKLVSHLGSKCSECGVAVRWAGPTAQGPYLGEASRWRLAHEWEHLGITTCRKASPVSVPNDRLFEELDKYEQASSPSPAQDDR